MHELVTLKRAIVVGAALGLSLFGAFSPAVATEDEDGAWVIFSTTDTFGTDSEPSRWHYWFDSQARYFDLGSGRNQWLMRPGIGYAVRDDMKAWVGYARFRSRSSSGIVSTEDRYWQQLDWVDRNWMDGQLSLRARLEQRSVSTGDDLGIVLRLMAKYARPVGSRGSTKLVISLEPFFNLNDTDWGGDARLSQNRVFLGANWQLTERTAIETGYMNQYVLIDDAEDRSNHLAIANFRVKF